MESKGLLLKIFGIITFAFLLSCAEDVDCFSNNSNLVKVTFLNTTNNQARNITFDRIAILSSRTDSSFLTVPVGTNLLNLPLDPFADEAGFVFFRPNRTDTLIFGYERFQRIISVQCGAEQAYGRLRLINSTFDSIAFINPALLRTNDTNIRIYE
jgi:hypothetical protein